MSGLMEPESRQGSFAWRVLPLDSSKWTKMPCLPAPHMTSCRCPPDLTAIKSPLQGLSVTKYCFRRHLLRFPDFFDLCLISQFSKGQQLETWERLTEFQTLVLWLTMSLWMLHKCIDTQGRYPCVRKRMILTPCLLLAEVNEVWRFSWWLTHHYFYLCASRWRYSSVVELLQKFYLKINSSS